MATAVGNVLLKFGADTRSFDKGTASVKRFEKKVVAANDNISKSSMLASQAIRTMGVAIAGFASVATVKRVIEIGDSINGLRIRVRSATNDVIAFNRNWERLRYISVNTGVALGNNVRLFQALSAASAQTGLGDAGSLDIVDKLNKLATSLGLAESEISSALVQLQQAATQGVLRYEELKPIMEQSAPLVARIAHFMGITTAELKAQSSEGIAIASVFGAILDNADEINKAYADTPVTLQLAGNRLREAFKGLIDDINQSFGLTSKLADKLDGVAGRVSEINGKQVGSEAVRRFAPLVSTIDQLGVVALTSSLTLLLLAKRFGIASRAGAVLSGATGGLISAMKVLGGMLFATTGTLRALGKHSASSVTRIGMLTGLFTTFGKTLLTVGLTAGKMILRFSWIGLVTGAVLGLVKSITGLDNVISLLDASMRSISSVFVVFGGLLDIVSFSVSSLVTWVVDKLKPAFDVVATVLKPLVGLLGDVASGVAGLVGNLLGTETDSPFLKGLQDRLKGIRTSLDDIWDRPLATGNEPADDSNDNGDPTGKKKQEERLKGIQAFSQRELAMRKIFLALNADTSFYYDSLEESRLETKLANALSMEETHAKAIKELKAKIKEEQAKEDSERDEEELKSLRQKLSKERALEQENTRIKELAEKQKAQATQRRHKKEDQALSTVLASAAEKSKEFFALQKAAALSQAFLDSAAAVSGAYRHGSQIGGPFLGAAFAAAAGVASALHVATVAKQSFKGRRTGGDVKAGEPFIGGESGLEMFKAGNDNVFIPPRDGKVINHNTLAGSMMANNDIRIYNQAPNASPVVQRRRNAVGGEEIKILIQEVKQDIAKDIRAGGSDIANSLEGTYAMLNRGFGGF